MIIKWKILILNINKENKCLMWLGIINLDSNFNKKLTLQKNEKKTFI